MKLKGKFKYFFIIPIVLLVLYIFIVAEPIGEDYFFHKQWIISIPESQNIIESDLNYNTMETPDILDEEFAGKDVLPFITESAFGYYTPDGELLRVQPINNSFSISKYFWAEYAKDSSNIIVYYPNGKKACEISFPGFVHFRNKRIFLFTPGGNGIREYNSNGDLLWDYTMPAPITSFNESNAGVIIGSSDGCLVYLNQSGKEIFNFYPGGSSLQVIMGATISENGDFIACVSGLNQQRLLLIKIENGQYKIIYHEYVPKEIAKQVRMLFDANNEFVFFESTGSIGMLNCKNLTTSYLPILGNLGVNSLSSYNDIFSILTYDDEYSYLALVDKKFRVISKTKFSSKFSSVIQEKDNLFLNLDSEIINIKIQGLKNEKN